MVGWLQSARLCLKLSLSSKQFNRPEDCVSRTSDDGVKGLNRVGTFGPRIGDLGQGGGRHEWPILLVERD